MEGQAVVDLGGADYNEGRGTLDSVLADPSKAARYLHVKNSDGSWRVRDDVWVYCPREGRPLLKGPLGLGYSVYGDQHHFGPELEFGHVVGDQLEGPILLIKTAWGGKSLYKDFRPPSSGGQVGKYYRLMISEVKEALRNLDTEFPSFSGLGYELSGFVWWQGWNDGIDPKNALPEYEQNLVNLVHDVRRDLGAPKLPVVVGELTGPWVQAPKDWDLLRRAQAAAIQRPEFAGNGLFVPTHDFVRKSTDSPNPGHGHHEFGNAETYLLVGDALGRAMLELLASRPNSYLTDYGLKPNIRLNHSLPYRSNRPWKLVCEMPYNCQFQPWIEAEGPGGLKLDFNSTNPLVQYLTPTESISTSQGLHDYEAKNWISGEGASYTIPAGVTVKAVQYRETGFKTSFAGSFHCNDEDFNILWQRAARTAYLCMRDHFYDCPDRERVGFWGDGTPELDQCFYIFDKDSHRLARDLALRKLEPKFYPGQHLEFLGEYGLWFYFLQTGDYETISSVYEATKNFLLNTYKFGDAKTWFDWGDDSKDTSVIETCFWYIDLGSLRKMALLTGHSGAVALIDAKMKATRDNFDARFWKGAFYQSGDVNSPDDRANAMAINAGLADESKWLPIYRNVLAVKRNASCFFDRWVFEALCKIGKSDMALMRMADRYRTMIDSPITTLWEHYDRWWASWLNAFDEGSSLNHGWNPPALLLSMQTAGIRPVEPGWATYSVKPQEAFLTALDVKVPSIRGPVAVKLRKSTRTYALSVDGPVGATAIVGIPRAPFARLDQILLDGQVVWQRGKVVQQAAWMGEENGYLEYKVTGGHADFLAKGELPLKSPKAPALIAKRPTPLDKHGWSARASVPDGTFAFSGAKIPIDVSAQNALDGDHWTGWRDMTSTQHPGQWFEVDMKRRQTFRRIVLENSWALWDSPAGYSVSVSNDGVHWSRPIAAGRGHLGTTEILFPVQSARYLRVTQTGSSSKYHWSIYELDVLRS
jgi:hypothetical protein